MVSSSIARVSKYPAESSDSWRNFFFIPGKELLTIFTLEGGNNYVEIRGFDFTEFRHTKRDDSLAVNVYGHNK